MQPQRGRGDERRCPDHRNRLNHDAGSLLRRLTNWVRPSPPSQYSTMISRLSSIHWLTSLKSSLGRLPGTISRGCGRTATETESCRHEPPPPCNLHTLTRTSCG